jgi:hypothetical protein
MRERLALATLLLAVLAGQAFAAKPAPNAVSSSNAKVAPAALTSGQAAKLAAARSQHLKAKAGLPPEQQLQLDRVALAVKGKLLAGLTGGDLLASATQLVSETVPDLDGAEAESIAKYALAAIASGTQRNSETQMSFNLQYLELLSQMQELNRDYEALGEILKAKHDEVENSIGNVR